MNWINPRDRLPEVGQLFWALCIENRENEYQSGAMPCANIEICEAIRSVFGDINGVVINHKGYQGGPLKYFYDWDYDENENSSRTCTDREERIVAWLPYIGLPSWNQLSVEESKKTIMEMPSYGKYKEVEKKLNTVKNKVGINCPKLMDALSKINKNSIVIIKRRFEK